MQIQPSPLFLSVVCGNLVRLWLASPAVFLVRMQTLWVSQGGNNALAPQPEHLKPWLQFRSSCRLGRHSRWWWGSRPIWSSLASTVAKYWLIWSARWPRRCWLLRRTVLYVVPTEAWGSRPAKANTPTPTKACCYEDGAGRCCHFWRQRAKSFYIFYLLVF